MHALREFYAIRRILRFGRELYFYDKLLVAYDIGGAKGLEDELGKIRASEKSSLELALVKDFEIKLKGLKDPAVFLGEKVA